MASCVKNILTKNYQNLIIGFQVTVKNVGDVFFETQCICIIICYRTAELSIKFLSCRRQWSILML